MFYHDKSCLSHTQEAHIERDVGETLLFYLLHQTLAIKQRNIPTVNLAWTRTRAEQTGYKNTHYHYHQHIIQTRP